MSFRLTCKAIIDCNPFYLISSSREGDGAVDKLRLRSDQRVAAMSKIAAEFPDTVKVITHVVHGKPENQMLKVAQKHVRKKSVVEA